MADEGIYASQVSPEPSPGPLVRWDLEGDLARMPLLSVLQFLESGRNTGLLAVLGPEGRQGQCLLREGVIADAAFRHLRGREAVLGLLGVRAGRFGFSFRDVALGTTRLPVSPLLMDLVRLEDEFERVSASFPGERVPLALRDPNEVPKDPLETGTDTVMASIAARPRVTLAELETSLPIAPLKVRLSVAWLSFTNRLRSQLSMTALAAPVLPAPGDWYAHLLLRYPGGLRVLFGTAPSDGPHELIAAITALAKALDAGPAWLSVGADGVGMARVRPRIGGLLSLASFPITEANTEGFRRFAGTAGLILMCNDAPKPVVDAWIATCPPDVPRSRLMCLPMGGCVTSAIREFAQKLALTSTPARPW